MATKKRPPPNELTGIVVPKEELHKRRATRIIKTGLTDMEAGKSPIFPMHKLIGAEADLLQAEIDASERKPKRRQKKNR